MKPLYFLPLVIIGLIGLAFWLGNGRAGQNDLPSTMIGRVAPGLELETLGTLEKLERDMLDGGDAVGGLKLVNFWASWCAPCRVEHPNLVALGEAGLPIYGINFKDDPANAFAFLEELGDPYDAIGADREGRNGFEWGVYGLPETFLLDGEGRVLARVAGPLTSSTYGRVLAPLLEEQGLELELGGGG